LISLKFNVDEENNHCDFFAVYKFNPYSSKEKLSVKLARNELDSLAIFHR
tara:strand:+ start:655 stop:804 length:150 start_codon:yes stop_codon:yes gene_type:complete